jgi:hypothetical protein
MEMMRRTCLAVKTTLAIAFLMGLLLLMGRGYEMHVIPLPTIVSAVLYVAIVVGVIWKLVTSEL